MPAERAAAAAELRGHLHEAGLAEARGVALLVGSKDIARSLGYKARAGAPASAPAPGRPVLPPPHGPQRGGGRSRSEGAPCLPPAAAARRVTPPPPPPPQPPQPQPQPQPQQPPPPPQPQPQPQPQPLPAVRSGVPTGGRSTGRPNMCPRGHLLKNKRNLEACELVCDGGCGKVLPP